MRLVFFVFAFFSVMVFSSAEVPQRSVVELGFPIVNIEKLPNLTATLTRKPPTNHNAFLQQLRRQAVLVAARDELGAITSLLL